MRRRRGRRFQRAAAEPASSGLEDSDSLGRPAARKLTDDPFLRDGTPEAAVTRPTIVAHHKKCPGGIFIGSGKLQVLGAQGRTSSSLSWTFPLTIACPSRTASVSPGTATIRLMQFTSSRSAVGRAELVLGVLHPARVALGALRRVEDDDVSAVGIVDPVVHAADEHALADVEGRLIDSLGMR